MTTENQLLREALQAAANYIDTLGGVSTSYRQALAQPTTEPAEGGEVFWIQPNHLEMAREGVFLCRVAPMQLARDFVPLYTAPPASHPSQKGLI